MSVLEREWLATWTNAVCDSPGRVQRPDRVGHRSSLLFMFGPSLHLPLEKGGNYYGVCYDFCALTAEIALHRARRPMVFAAAFAPLRRAATGTPGPCSTGRVQPVSITIGTPCRAHRPPQVRTRCFRAQALHLPCPPHPMGFAMRCQLARRPGLLCSFCPSPRTFALRRPGHSQSSRRSGGQEQNSLLLQSPPSPSGQVLAALPLPSASGYHRSMSNQCRYSHRGLPPHHIAPMLGAHQSFHRTLRMKPRKAGEFKRVRRAWHVTS